MNLEMLDMYCASLACEIEAGRDRISDSSRPDSRREAPRREAGRGILAGLAGVLRFVYRALWVTGLDHCARKVNPPQTFEW